ncbi:MAG: anaerobic ribonucleoside-triphosphate reductase activating protein [Clostridiales bacterium]|nr:anaerobic ribonucleoside-triphosphate reductase activating protein [Clostridiales bacterium]
MNYHNITKDDMLNGDGLRVVLWVAGCSHHCKGCQNPITWNEKSGLYFDEKAKCEIFDLLEKDYISGITFSGGDPLMPCNREVVGNLIKEITVKFPNKNIWLYTGFTFDEVKDLDFIKFVDVLVDGRFEENLKDEKLLWKGSSNQRVIDVKKSLNNNTICLHCGDYN